MSKIHPTAIVSSNAKMGSDVEIGPYAIIEDDVEIGDECIIGAHAGIYNGARLGNGVKIFHSASIANMPQDLKFANERTFLYIGDNTVVREFTALHKGTTATGKTTIGSNCLIMSLSHVAHDCQIGNNVIIAGGVQIAGHVHVEDTVIIGGLVAIHQFSKIGQHAMVGGGSMANADIPPYCMTSGYPARFMGLNIVGLRRRNFSNADIEAIKEAYRIFYNSGLIHTAALEQIKEKFGDHPLVKNIIEFIGTSQRGVLRK
jgi:UDP-N-acetylglucosamine acyltransferase